MNLNEYFQMKHQKTIEKLNKIKNENDYLIFKEMNERNYIAPYSKNILNKIKICVDDNCRCNSVDFSKIHEILRKKSDNRLITNLKRNYFIPFYINKDFIKNEDEKNNNKNFCYKSFSPIVIKKNNVSDLFNNLKNNENCFNNSNNNLILKTIKNFDNKNSFKKNVKNYKNKNIYEKRKNDVKIFSKYYKI